METWMSLAMLIYATALSFLLAMWITWMSLRSIFRMFPATRLTAVSIRAEAQRGTGTVSRHAA